MRPHTVTDYNILNACTCLKAEIVLSHQDSSTNYQVLALLWDDLSVTLVICLPALLPVALEQMLGKAFFLSPSSFILSSVEMDSYT